MTSVQRTIAYILSGYFAWIMGFGEENLQPALLNKFLLSTCGEWFVYRRKVIATLRDHAGTGIHTDIFTLDASGTLTRFFWSHVSVQPFGNPTPIQCTGCLSLRSWKEPKVRLENQELVSVVFRCKVCKTLFQAEKPADGPLFRVGPKGPSDLSERGEWFYSTIL